MAGVKVEVEVEVKDQIFCSVICLKSRLRSEQGEEKQKNQ